MKPTKVVGTLLTLTLFFGIGIASSVTANAQWTQYPSSRNREYEREQIRRQRQIEREQRRQQRRASRDYGYDNSSRDYGYDNYGYGRTNDGLPNYGGSFELRQTALNAGYNEGIKEGRKDRQNNERFEFQDEEDYRNANTDYSSRLGNRELYRQYFRSGFQNGYRDGYGNNGYNY
jgi:hypothetical protein